MKKTILLMLGMFMLLLIPIVSAEEPLIFKQNQVLDYKIYCFDEDDNYCNNATICKITIFYPNSTVLINNQNMTWNPSYFHYTLNESQTNILGEYSGNAQCNGTTGGYTSFNYWITYSGTKLTISHSLVYIMGWVIMIVIFIVCLIGAFAIKGDNEFDVGGEILKVNMNKYIKLGLAYLSYLLFVFVIFFSWQITLNFLFLNFIADILRMFFMILMYLAFPLFLLTVVVSLMKWFLDMKLQKLAERGLPKR